MDSVGVLFGRPGGHLRNWAGLFLRAGQALVATWGTSTPAAACRSATAAK